MKKLLFVCFITAIFFYGCKKGGGTNNPPNGDESVNINFAGQTDEGEGGDACVWKNGVKTVLPGVMGGQPNSISFNGDFVGGRTWQDGGQTRFSPCFWSGKNRTDLPLLDPRGDGWVASIDIGGGNVYAAGTASDSLEFFANSGWRYLPCYWAGGKVTQLELLNGFGSGWAESIAVLPGGGISSVYIAGTSHADNGYDEPCLWSNTITSGPNAGGFGSAQLSSFGYGGSAMAVCLDQNNWYVAGYIYNQDDMDIPCVWTEGSRTELNRPSANHKGSASAICLNGLQVCVAGNVSGGGGNVPCVWVNGTRTDLPTLGFDSKAISIQVIKGDIYVGGYVYSNGSTSHPCYWKNGELFYDSKMISKVYDIKLSPK